MTKEHSSPNPKPKTAQSANPKPSPKSKAGGQSPKAPSSAQPGKQQQQKQPQPASSGKKKNRRTKKGKRAPRGNGNGGQQQQPASATKKQSHGPSQPKSQLSQADQRKNRSRRRRGRGNRNGGAGESAEGNVKRAKPKHVKNLSNKKTTRKVNNPEAAEDEDEGVKDHRPNKSATKKAKVDPRLGPQNAVYCTGLRKETEKADLIKYFIRFGKIKKAHVVKDAATGRSRCYGYVVYKQHDKQAAQRAVAEVGKLDFKALKASKDPNDRDPVFCVHGVCRIADSRPKQTQQQAPSAAKPAKPAQPATANTSNLATEKKVPQGTQKRGRVGGGGSKKKKKQKAYTVENDSFFVMG